MRILALLFLVTILSCNCIAQVTKYVNPFIGTGGHGHTFPGACRPFGMVQLSPDNDVSGWDWCSGYHASDSSIMGFSHTHLSGTGGADYGDILVKPLTGKLYLTPGDKQHKTPGYRSLFSHGEEHAVPGYYRVVLSQHNILTELTATERGGMQRYTFNSADSIHIIVDLKHGIADHTVESSIKIINDRKISGLRRSSGWAENQYVYFVMEFSEPFTKTIWSANTKYSTENAVAESNEGVVASFEFAPGEGKTILVKSAISAVDVEGAEKNLAREIPDWDFTKVQTEALAAWEMNLGKIQVETNRLEDKTKFYTALYHCMIAPNIFSDVDGRYRGMDNKIHTANGYTHYTVFSLWDTFRALHPLLNLIDRKRSSDFVRSMLDKYEQSGLLPVWELAANETNCMIGYHAVPVIADAIVHNIPGFDRQFAFTAMKKSSNQSGFGVPAYNTYGFVPSDRETDAISRTIEYAIDDRCIAYAARYLKMKDEENTYMERSHRYENVYDTTIGFLRGRYSDGRWKKEFDPAETFPWGVGDFTEGNSWQYSWLPFQDSSTYLVNNIEKLDRLFTAQQSEKYRKVSDVTGLIGEYAHGNEPSHWISYLYAHGGQPVKTQKYVRKIMDEFYSTQPDGLIGNEDCGQMSAWFVFSALGFYPVMPASGEYVLGSPLFNKALIKLENGRTIRIQAPANNSSNIYVGDVILNNKRLTNAMMPLQKILNGAELNFRMLTEAPKDKGLNQAPRFHTRNTVAKNQPPFTPYIELDQHTFFDSLSIHLQTQTKDAEVRYTVDGSTPKISSKKYTAPITIRDNTQLKAKTFKRVTEKGKKRIIESLDMFEQTFNKSIFQDSVKPFYRVDTIIYPQLTHHAPYAFDYPASGPQALIDGKRATIRYIDKNWQSHDEKHDLDVTIDLGKQTKVDQISIGFLHNADVWILYPQYVTISYSTDGKEYTQLIHKTMPVLQGYVTERMDVSTGKVNASMRYIKVFAKNHEGLPEWHRARGRNVLMFTDEILIHPKN